MKVVRQLCSYSKHFRLSDVFRQVVLAYPYETVEISILGCMAFEWSESLTASLDVTSMLQVPKSVIKAHIPLLFTDSDPKDSLCPT